MNIDELRTYCSSLPGTTEDFPFDEQTIAFRVKGKIYLLCDIYGSPFQANMKCDPEKAIELREQYRAIQPGWHMNKKHWNTVDFEDDVSESLIKDLIKHSYELVSGNNRKG